MAVFWEENNFYLSACSRHALQVLVLKTFLRAQA